jgi:hypothetical protein
MLVTLQRQEASWVIKLEGRITVTSAAEVKDLLLEWVSSGKSLEFDLEQAEEIDITIMQLIWAAARTGGRVVAHMSPAAALMVRDAGFAQLPEFPVCE